MENKYFVTGGDYLSLPQITPRGEVQTLTFLHGGARGLIQLLGAPFLRAFVLRGDENLLDTQMQSRKLQSWIPQFFGRDEHGEWETTVLTPVHDKVFLIRTSYINRSSTPQTITLGFDGTWTDTTREVNESEPILAAKCLYFGWNEAPVYALSGVFPLFCFSFLCDSPTQRNCICDNQSAVYAFSKTHTLVPNERVELTIAVGFGNDGVSAVTSALHALRKSFSALLGETLQFLQARSVATALPLADQRIHENLFFCYFFSSGRTLDTEQFVCVTSRSPRYYVSAAYWDRDTLLWAFPAILRVDCARAKEILHYAFTVQLPRVGEHSRFIDGTLLEPGFELDEWIAPLIALCDYCEKTGERAWERAPFLSGVTHILDGLQEKRHTQVWLYRTFLYPSDDMRHFPYLTYDNALVARALERLGGLTANQAYNEWAKKIRKDILSHCITTRQEKQIFSWCCDLQGNHLVYDEPPGSLILLAYLGLCPKDDPVFQNTCEMLYASDAPYAFLGANFQELGCAHANHPWVLSFCNRILSSTHTQTCIEQMLTMEMDNGLACESVDEYTGKAKTGDAFATCAGLYAYALMRIFCE